MQRALASPPKAHTFIEHVGTIEASIGPEHEMCEAFVPAPFNDGLDQRSAEAISPQVSIEVKSVQFC
jgi:hypothetical protein